MYFHLLGNRCILETSRPHRRKHDLDFVSILFTKDRGDNSRSCTSGSRGWSRFDGRLDRRLDADHRAKHGPLTYWKRS
jgi:hypothetical protein